MFTTIQSTPSVISMGMESKDKAIKSTFKYI